MSAALQDGEIAETDKDIFLECAARLALAEEAEGDNRLRGLAAIAFRDGEQWDDKIKTDRSLEGRPALTINHTDTLCVRTENTLKQQRPRIKCQPVGGGARIEDAQVVNGLIRHIETLSNASVAYDTGGVSAIDIGWGYWRIASEYVNPMSFDQDLKILPIMNTFTVYMDPASVMPAGEDQDWCIISETMKRSEYRLKYRSADNIDFTGGDAPGDVGFTWENKENIRLAEYYRKYDKRDTLCMLSNGRTALKSGLPDAQTLLAMGIRITDTRPTITTQIQWFRLNGKKVVEKRDLPGKYIPVIRCQGNRREINGRVKRKGMVENLIDPARMFNYSESMKAERYALAPKAPWVAFEGVIEGHPEWHTANQKAYSVLVAKAVQGPNGELLPLPARQPPPQIESGMAEWSQSAERNLMAVAGMPMENSAEQQRVVSGNKYLARRQGERDLTHFQYYDNQTMAVMWTGIILLDQIPYYYDTKRMQRIIGEDGTPQMVTINDDSPDAQETGAVFRIKHNLTVGRYDIVMDTGPNYTTKREEDAEKVIGALGTPLGEKMVTVGPDIVARDLGMDEMADRLAPTTPQGMEKAVEGLSSQGKAIVTSLQQQVQQMQQVIDKQAMEIKYKGTIEAAKLETADTKSKRDDATKRYDIDVDAHTRRDVAEIGAAAQLLNTSAESSHEERQADKLIEKGLEDSKK